MSDKCNSCGAEIQYEAGSQSLKCPYCGASNEIKRAEDQVPSTVEKIIPLTVTHDDLEKRAYAYMASGNYTPDDMLESTTFTKQECFYVPAFLFRVEYEATWTASFGYDRTEHYTEYVTVTKRSGNHSYETQEPRTKTKTVTDWRPANGVDSGSFRVSAYAGKKLFESGCSAKNGKEPIETRKKNSSNWIGSLASKLESLGNKKSSEVDAATVKDESGLAPVELVKYAISQALVQNNIITDFNPSFMKGVEGENFSVSESIAYSNLKSEINANIDQRVEKNGQGDRQKDWHWNAKMSHLTNTLYVPICHAVFDYQGTEYHVWIDGIGDSEIRADKLPEDKGRKKLIYLGFIPAGVATIIGIVNPGSYVLAIFFVGYAAIRRYQIITYSKKIRDSLLTQIHVSASVVKEMSGEERDKIAKAFQRPEKPFFAKTHKDIIVLPLLSFLSLLMLGVPGIIIGAVIFLGGYAVIASKKKVKSSLLTQTHAHSELTKDMSDEKRDGLASPLQPPENLSFTKKHKRKIIFAALAFLLFIGWLLYSGTASTKNSKKTQQADGVSAQAPVTAPEPTAPVVVKTETVSSVAVASSANWTKITESNDGKLTLYVKQDSIRKTGDKAIIWEMVDYKTAGINTISGKPYLSVKSQNEFDCKENKWRSLNDSTSYTGNMGNGEITDTSSSSNPVPGEWNQAAPNTVMDVVGKIACGQTIQAPTGVVEASPIPVVPQSASFDCKKAKSNSEVLICSDAALSKLDYELAEIYRRAKAKALDAQEFKKQTVAAWQWRENNCRDNKECLVKWYTDRKDILLKVIQDGI